MGASARRHALSRRLHVFYAILFYSIVSICFHFVNHHSCAAVSSLLFFLLHFGLLFCCSCRLSSSLCPEPGPPNCWIGSRSDSRTSTACTSCNNVSFIANQLKYYTPVCRARWVGCGWRARNSEPMRLKWLNDAHEMVRRECVRFCKT